MKEILQHGLQKKIPSFFHLGSMDMNLLLRIGMLEKYPGWTEGYVSCSKWKTKIMFPREELSCSLRIHKGCYQGGLWQAVMNPCLSKNTSQNDIPCLLFSASFFDH